MTDLTLDILLPLVAIGVTYVHPDPGHNRTTGSDMALGSSLIPDGTIALSGNRGHSDLCGPPLQHSFQTLARPQAAAQVPGLCVGHSGNLGHRLQHRPQLRLDHGLRPGPRQHLSQVDTLVPGRSPSHSDQDSSGSDMAPEHQQGNRF